MCDCFDIKFLHFAEHCTSDALDDLGVENGVPRAEVTAAFRIDGEVELGDDYAGVEVQSGYSRNKTEVDAIDAAIEALIVVRDSLRKLQAVA